MQEEQLFDLKKEIEKSKSKVSEKKGHLQSLMDDLKKKWDCTTLEQAKKKEKELESRQEKIDGEIEKGLEELEENYEFE